LYQGQILNLVSVTHRWLNFRLGLVLCLALATFSARAQPQRRELTGHVPNAVSRLQPLHRLAATYQIHLAIGLPARQPEAMKALLDEIYDPASPNYQHYLSPAEFTAAFGPTEEDYQTVINFATNHGLTILSTHSNRLVLDVRGAVADIERAFQVRMQVYPHPTEAREFYAPDTEPSVEADIPILDIGGLNNYVLPRPRLVRRPATANGSNGVDRVGSGPDNLGYSGSDFRAAYAAGITNTGTGQSIGLVEFDNYYPNDISLYESNAKMTTSTVVSNRFLNGFGGTPGTGNEEVALDIELSIAMAPGLSKVYVYSEDYPTNGAAANGLLDQMATDDLAKQLSCSWVIPTNATTDTILVACAMNGQSFFDASGDSGGLVGDIPPPSDDPYMTQVGGTDLTTTGPAGAWVSEVVWDPGRSHREYAGSSGGVSDLYPIPSWQQGVNISGTAGSAYLRNFPDVAMVAENVFTVSDNGQLGSVSGTSCGGPLWAGFAALVNQQAAATGKARIGFLNPSLYRIASQSAYAANFHDVTVGDDFNLNCVSEFLALPGYDLCTGWGSMIGSKLFNALLATADALQITPLATLYLSGPTGGPFNITSRAFSLTNTSASPLNWTNINAASWLSVSPGGGTLAAHTVSPTVTVSLSNNAKSLAAGIYNATVWFSNEVSQIGQGRQFSFSVGQPVVANGSFETADLSDWILAGDDGTSNFVDNGTYTGLAAESGSYFMVMLTQVAPLPTLSQTVATFTGQPYTLSFWLENPDVFGAGSSPNQFSIAWNGTSLFNQTNVPTISSWTNFLFHVVAPGTSSTLQFAGVNFNGVFALDNVSLTPMALPQLFAIHQSKGLLTSTWSVVPGQSYQVQYSTNLAGTNWINLTNSFTATSTNFSTTNATTGTAPRFYRMELLW
jgi:subtilase family serine protease